MKRLAYLFPIFPVLHQTFTLGEVLGLKRKGYEILLVSLKGSNADLQQPEAQPLIGETRYCPRLLSAAMLGSFVRALIRRPLDVMRLFGCVISAWQKRSTESKEADASPPPATLTRVERLLGFYHHNPYLYLGKSLSLVPYAIYVSEMLERDGVGHVHAHWATYPTTVAYLIKQWSGIPYSFTAHAYDIYMISRMLPTKIENALFVVTCADVNRRYLAGLCTNGAGARIHVNYHGADLGRFSPERSGPRSETARFRIMSCGWLKEYKGFHVLLEALALLVERDIDAVLDLAGDGPQRPYLESRSRELGIVDRVSFHGYLGHDRLIELYRSVDVFALPSIVMGRYGRQDVIPNVLAEAMAAGTPAVGSDIGGVSELIEHEVSGLLVRERDPVALADALERIAKEPGLAARLSVAGRERVESIWDRNENLTELAGLIETYIAA